MGRLIASAMPVKTSSKNTVKISSENTNQEGKPETLPKKLGVGGANPNAWPTGPWPLWCTAVSQYSWHECKYSGTGVEDEQMKQMWEYYLYENRLKDDGASGAY